MKSTHPPQEPRGEARRFPSWRAHTRSRRAQDPGRDVASNPRWRRNSFILESHAPVPSRRWSDCGDPRSEPICKCRPGAPRLHARLMGVGDYRRARAAWLETLPPADRQPMACSSTARSGACASAALRVALSTTPKAVARRRLPARAKPISTSPISAARTSFWPSRRLPGAGALPPLCPRQEQLLNLVRRDSVAASLSSRRSRGRPPSAQRLTGEHRCSPRLSRSRAADAPGNASLRSEARRHRRFGRCASRRCGDRTWELSVSSPARDYPARASIVLGGARGCGRRGGERRVQILAVVLLVAGLGRCAARPSSRRATAALIIGLYVIYTLLTLVPLPASIWTGPGRAGPDRPGYELLRLDAPALPAALQPQIRSPLPLLLPPAAMFLLVLQLFRAASRASSDSGDHGGALDGLGIAQLLGGPGSDLRFYAITNQRPVAFSANGNHLGRCCSARCRRGLFRGARGLGSRRRASFERRRRRRHARRLPADRRRDYRFLGRLRACASAAFSALLIYGAWPTAGSAAAGSPHSAPSSAFPASPSRARLAARLCPRS